MFIFLSRDMANQVHSVKYARTIHIYHVMRASLCLFIVHSIAVCSMLSVTRTHPFPKNKSHTMDAHRLNELRYMIDSFITTMNAKLDTLWNMVEGAPVHLSETILNELRGFMLDNSYYSSSDINTVLDQLRGFIQRSLSDGLSEFKSELLGIINQCRDLESELVEVQGHLHLLMQSTPHIQTLSKLRTSTLCTRIVGM